MKPILLVEDNADDVFFMRRALKQAGIQNRLIVLEDGEAAMRTLEDSLEEEKRGQEALPGLILLDVNLPGRSGIEILKWIRSHPELHALATVVMISSETAWEGKLANESGADAIMVKPPTPPKLNSLKDKTGAPLMLTPTEV